MESHIFELNVKRIQQNKFEKKNTDKKTYQA